MNINSSYSYAASLVTGNVNASKNPAGVAIDEEMKTQITGTDVGSRNAQSGQDVLKVADGALGNVADMLVRMRELAVQASNSAIYSSDEIGDMQKEVEQLKLGIQDAASNTEFNTKKLLDGSMADANLATNPDGSGMAIHLENSSLETLGIADFDLTGDFDIDTIDQALKKVNSQRAEFGAQSNALDSVKAYNSLASENLSKASDNLEDVDVEQYVSEKNKKKLLDLYQMYAQKLDVHNQESFITKMFS